MIQFLLYIFQMKARNYEKVEKVTNVDRCLYVHFIALIFHGVIQNTVNTV